MILSNVELHKALDSGRLIITPEPSPRTPDIDAQCPYGTHSVDLKLHNEILVPTSGKFTIDLSQLGSLPELIKKNSEKYIINKKQPYILKPSEFILGRTVETISLPVKGKSPPYLGARIEGKSSRARFGLIVHCTAPTVHPNFEGVLTLEIVNLGPAPISLYFDMYIAQLIVEEVTGEIILNPSEFQGQSSADGSA